MNIRIADAIHAAIAVLWASLVATASGAERPANPQSIPVTTPLMAVDAKLHSAFKEYIGLRTAREGSVFHVAHGLKDAGHARGAFAAGVHPAHVRLRGDAADRRFSR